MVDEDRGNTMMRRGGAYPVHLHCTIIMPSDRLLAVIKIMRNS